MKACMVCQGTKRVKANRRNPQGMVFFWRCSRCDKPSPSVPFRYKDTLKGGLGGRVVLDDKNMEQLRARVQASMPRKEK